VLSITPFNWDFSNRCFTSDGELIQISNLEEQCASLSRSLTCPARETLPIGRYGGYSPQNLKNLQAFPLGRYLRQDGSNSEELKLLIFINIVMRVIVAVIL